MKFIQLACLALLLSVTTRAQNLVGIFAGGQGTTAHYMLNEVKQNTDFKYGFQAGLMMKVPFDKDLFFVPQVFYSMKGYKVKFNQFAFPPGPDAVDNDVTLHCVELAGLLQADFSGKPTHAFIRFGPTLDFQIFGHEKFNQNGTPSTVSRKMPFGYNEYGHYSANALGQFGVETASGFSVYLNYSFGLTSINNADYGPQITHRCFGITIAKYLNPNKIVIDTRNKE